MARTGVVRTEAVQGARLRLQAGRRAEAGQAGLRAAQQAQRERVAWRRAAQQRHIAVVGELQQRREQARHLSRMRPLPRLQCPVNAWPWEHTVFALCV